MKTVNSLKAKGKMSLPIFFSYFDVIPASFWLYVAGQQKLCFATNVAKAPAFKTIELIRHIVEMTNLGNIYFG